MESLSLKPGSASSRSHVPSGQVWALGLPGCVIVGKALECPEPPSALT